MQCQLCGHLNQEVEIYCASCGVKLALPPSPAMPPQGQSRDALTIPSPIAISGRFTIEECVGIIMRQKIHFISQLQARFQ